MHFSEPQIEKINNRSSDSGKSETHVAGATFRDGTFLTWDELKLTENGTTYVYKASAISDTNIDEYAFAGCQNLAQITIPSSVTSISEQAFSFCESLNNIMYIETTAQWKQITFGEHWNSSPSVTVIHGTDGDIT